MIVWYLFSVFLSICNMCRYSPRFVRVQTPIPFFFIETSLFPFCSFPSLQILPVKEKKHKRVNERQWWRGAKSLGGEGPIKQAPTHPFFFLLRMLPEMEGDERREKNLLPILSKDRFFSQSEREANREAGSGLDWRRGRSEGGGQVVSNTKTDERTPLLSEKKTDILFTAHKPNNQHGPVWWKEILISTKLWNIVSEIIVASTFYTTDILHIDLFHHCVSRKF